MNKAAFTAVRIARGIFGILALFWMIGLLSAIMTFASGSGELKQLCFVAFFALVIFAVYWNLTKIVEQAEQGHGGASK